jgi:hypothetical protein
MAAIDDLIVQYRAVRDEMLADVQHWRQNGWTLRENDRDITERWLSEQQKRADRLADVIAAYEKRNG